MTNEQQIKLLVAALENMKERAERTEVKLRDALALAQLLWDYIGGKR